VEVVGESFHEKEIKRALKGHLEGDLMAAVLVPEPSNPRDRNAVRVDLLVDDRLFTVGHLGSEVASGYQAVPLPLASEERWGTVDAKVWHGQDTIQFYLRLAEPDKILPRQAPVSNGVVLESEWSATVTGEEQHQDILRGLMGTRRNPVEAVFSLDFCEISKGKYAGQRTIQVSLDNHRGRAHEEANRSI
jgi:hypothetical protein